MKGFVEDIARKIYNGQNSSSRRRKHKLPEYTFKEFLEWFNNQENINQLIKDWVDSGYDKMMRLSVDRLDDSKGYAFSNIQLTNWKSNHLKGSIAGNIVSNKKRYGN